MGGCLDAGLSRWNPPCGVRTSKLAQDTGVSRGIRSRKGASKPFSEFGGKKFGNRRDKLKNSQPTVVECGKNATRAHPFILLKNS